MSFGKQLRNARIAKDMTQKQLALCIGAKHNSVSNWENDISKPDIATLETLCKILCITPNAMLEMEDHGFTAGEVEMVQTYRKLDNHSKNLVSLVIREEVKRTDSIEPTKKDMEAMWTKMGMDAHQTFRNDYQEKTV